MKFLKVLLSLLLLVILSSCLDIEILLDERYQEEYISLENIPEYGGEPYVVINNNEPAFDEKEYTTDTFIQLTDLDELGRTKEAYACLGKEAMPKDDEERGSIGMVKPSGWQTKRYDKSLVDGGYIYNRCHLIAWCLSSLNAEEKNLMTGTRSFNIDGMLPFENKVADYIDDTSHHVLYKAIPIYKNDELVARGLNLQAASVEDDEIRINVYIYNVQDGIEINYLTGQTQLSNIHTHLEENVTYVLNINTYKFHRVDCSKLADTKAKNKRNTSKSREELLNEGYEPCQSCNP